MWIYGSRIRLVITNNRRNFTVIKESNIYFNRLLKFTRKGIWKATQNAFDSRIIIGAAFYSIFFKCIYLLLLLLLLLLLYILLVWYKTLTRKKMNRKVSETSCSRMICICKLPGVLEVRTPFCIQKCYLSLSPFSLF